MNILLVEDEGRIAKRLERILRSILGTSISSIAICDSLELGLNSIKTRTPDLLFLDLNLNGEDGYEILREVASESFHTIIVSAHKDRAIKAFEFGVLDFVPKPFSEERLSAALQKLYEKRQEQHQIKFLSIKKRGKCFLLNVDKVKFVKGAGIYTEINMEDGCTEIHNKSMENLSILLPDNFERIHKSYLVDMNRAKEIIIEPGSKYNLLLANGDRLPMGRTRYKEVKEKWFK